MTTEQEKLLFRIIDGILSADEWNGPITGNYPNRKCQFCSGSDSGYYDSQQFDHDKNCPFILNKQLKELDAIREEN